MATTGSQEAICELVEDSALDLETEATADIHQYSGLVVFADTLMVGDERAGNLRLYNRHNGKLLTQSHKLESSPRFICHISNTEVAVILWNNKAEILLFKSTGDTGEITLVRTLDIKSRFFSGHAVAKVKLMDKLVFSGSKRNMMCWCVVSLTDGHVGEVHNICKGDGSSHLAIKNNTVYISCWSGHGSPDNSGVYAYDIDNPQTLKFLYQHSELTIPGSITVDTRGSIFVYNGGHNIHQLTTRGELVTVHTMYQWPSSMFYEDQERVIYTITGGNTIIRYRLEYLHQPGVPVEIFNMDNRSIQLFEEALKDGKETVYNIRVMVVGHLGVGKTTLIKRLLGEEVNISERRSTEGIDIYVNCCDVSLSTDEWTVQKKDSKMDSHLQRIARVLNEQQSTKHKVADEEPVIIPPQGERTPKSHEGPRVAVELVYTRSPPQDFGQVRSSTSSQQGETPSVLVERQPTQSETNTMTMLKLLQENAYKLKQDTGINALLTMWDFAGQYAFYTTHQTFLTRRAIYLLVSNISEHVTDIVADECYFDSEGIMKCKVHELIEVWLNSIHCCSPSPEAGIPPVILVGTHVDKILQKQSPAKGIESKTHTTDTTSEPSRASTIFGVVKKKFKPEKTEGITEMNPISAMTGILAVDQPETRRKWRFWKEVKKKGRVDTDTKKRSLVEILPIIPEEVVMHPDDYSTPAGVDAHSNQEIVIALHDFTRRDPDELSISKGDKLILIEKSQPRWWQARNSLGEVGFVRSNYVQSDFRSEICERYFREIRSYLRDKPTRFNLVDEDFAIDNTVVDSKLKDLKKKIVEVASQQSYWGEVIPARWLPLEQELMKLKAAGIKVIPWSLLEDLKKAGAVQIATDELDLFLRFQHDIGTILYFSKELLKEKIVLDPQWMIDALKSLITAEMFVLRSTPAVADKWFEFKEKGKLSPELIDAVWTKKKNQDLHDNKEHMLLLMEQLNIIAKLRLYNEDAMEIKEENYFLAPFMLRQKTPKDIICPEPHCQMESSSVLCYVFTGKFLPSPIFHRLLAACVAHWPIATKKKEETIENLIFCGCCVFQLDHYHKLTLHFRDYIIFMRVSRKGIKDKTPSSELCIEVREFVTAMLIKIIGYLGQCLKFEHFIQCPEYTGDSINSLIPVSLLKKNAEVCCDFHDNMIESYQLWKFWFKGNMFSKQIKPGATSGDSNEPMFIPAAGDTRRALPPGKRYHAFFSYSSSDIQWVRKTVETLEKDHGFICCEYDRDNIPGTPLLKFADDSIRNAFKTVVVMTREAFQSDFVIHEIQMAMIQGFNERRNCIVPVLLEDCAVPSYLSVVNYIDARDTKRSDIWWPKLLMELETQGTRYASR